MARRKLPLEFLPELLRLETEGRDCEVLCGRADIEREGGKVTAVAESDVVVLRVDDRFYVYFYRWWSWYRGWKPKHGEVLTLTTHRCKNGLCGERVYAIYGDAEILEDLAWATESLRGYYVTVVPKSEVVIVEHEHYDAETHPKRVWHDHYVYCKRIWLVPMGLA